jgi:hypothetical protein
LKIFGENFATNLMQLRTADNVKNKFERGEINGFTFEVQDLGKV